MWELKANLYTPSKKPCDRDRVCVTYFVLGISYPHAAERWTIFLRRPSPAFGNVRLELGTSGTKPTMHN